MNITEEDAKTKWCPMASETTIVNVGDISKSTESSLAKCKGSGCMMWRKGEPMQGLKISDMNTPDHKSESISIPTGYCGIAGDPSSSFTENHGSDEHMTHVKWIP